MARKGINREQVFKVAKELVSKDKLPTAFNIRNKLATGSMATVQKYLQEWKKSCFKVASLNDYTEEHNWKKHTELLEKHQNLTQEFKKQANRAEHYASELINAENTIIKLKEENHHLQTTNQELQLKLTESTAGYEFLEKHYQELKTALDHNNNEIIKNQQQIIEKLQTEIKTINSASVELLRQTSAEGHDLLMQEKLQTINLQAKIDSLNKQLVETQQQLTAALVKVQISQQHSNWQQQLIEKFINPEELQQLELRELQLRSTVKARGSHGT